MRLISARYKKTLFGLRFLFAFNLDTEETEVILNGVCNDDEVNPLVLHYSTPGLIPVRTLSKPHRTNFVQYICRKRRGYQISDKPLNTTDFLERNDS